METGQNQMANSNEPIKPLECLNKLKSKYEEFKENFDDLQTERKDYLEKREQLKRRLEELKEKMRKVRTEEQNLGIVNPSSTAKKDNFLQNICLLFGFQLSKHLMEQNAGTHLDQSATNNDLHKLLSDLVNEACPKHPELTELRTFLGNSQQDIKSILVYLEKIFDEIKQKDENKMA